jgi:hypothetical protein
MNEEDTNRFQEANCYAAIARNYLLGVDNPEEVKDSQICANGTSRKKDLRLLSEQGYLIRSLTRKPPQIYGYSYGASEKRHIIRNFEKDSQAFASRHQFSVNWVDLFNESAWCNIDENGDRIETIGYIDIQHLSTSSVLDVYWNKDDFDFIKRPKDKSYVVYPKALLQQRMIGVLRCLVESQFGTTFSRELEKRAGLPVNALPDDERLIFQLRNYSFTPYHFNDESFNSSTGFLQEIDDHIAYLKALRSRAQKLNHAASEAGGFKALIKQYRKYLIKDLLEEAPVTAFKKFSEEYAYTDEERVLRIQILGAKYILEHAGFFEYDTLFGSDEEVAYISGGLGGRGEGAKSESPYREEYVLDENASKLIEAELPRT